MDQKKIDRINELARKQKREGLTEEERHEQALLRREYIDAVTISLRTQLDNTWVIGPDGAKHKLRS